MKYSKSRKQFVKEQYDSGKNYEEICLEIEKTTECSPVPSLRFSRLIVWRMLRDLGIDPKSVQKNKENK